MQLLIIGHTAHYFRGSQIVGWGPIVKEIDWLARAFEQVTYLACFHPGPAPPSALPYAQARIRFVPVPPAGGLRIRDKLGAILVIPTYLRVILRQLPTTDVIHVRAPHSLALVAMLMLAFEGNKPRWVKYAGDWTGRSQGSTAFGLQRWWLKQGFSRGPVTINGRWPDQPGHVFTLDNPSLTLQEVYAARVRVKRKELTSPVRLVFAGRLEAAKGPDVALHILRRLNQEFDARLDVLGNGIKQSRIVELCEALGLQGRVAFHGWVSHDRVKDFLAGAHFVLLPSFGEGWPKILSEAMAYGAVPLASQVSAIPQILGETGAGLAISRNDPGGFTQAIAGMIKEPSRWKQMSLAGVAAAPRFTYERYLIALDEMFSAYYGASPLDRSVVEESRAHFEGAAPHA